ncbi:MAG: ATP-binding protein [Anaerolineae bacterium]|nr:ATP-binding protein [Anaerolineae bacterium]
MPLEDHNIIDEWTEEDLLELPNTETDEYEFKSSLIREMPNYRNELQSKIVKTASAFWNTGGGILIVGVDDNGKIDGGIPGMMGKQKLRDWVDAALRGVTPPGPYSVRTIRPDSENSAINLEHVVLVVAFGESYDLPHMAPDNRYYVRAGAHSNPANNYLVEAIRARRGLRRPMLRALLRENPQRPGVVELTVLAINDLPALNVEIDFAPVPTLIQEQFPDRLPLKVSVIDRTNPFRMDIATQQRLTYWLGEAPFHVILNYEGIQKAPYSETQELDHHRNLNGGHLWLSDGNSPNKTLKKIHKQLSRLNNLVEKYVSDDSEQK